ncbi:predicted protein [Ostreococcus lucimarinus CCE9901]|uniref:Uncharacterized protein n=1 Tax=Ostreococcus lucimarinus (strain CCE9901) TaxID=436017 RepID=A4S7M4_OSTLU|nr:predicted protein [Ostreococcus lucimarinus CCE9901]ABO99590.1 predicted protein [Ostreococcus lucimarinus CCE9901]|eukprot:XP_001421297.1 predicted protein [Ostreococcus lucimarinus CCE9901]
MSNILRAMSDGTPYNFIVKPHLLYDDSAYLSVVTEKLRLRLRMAWLMRAIYTSYIHILTLITLLMYN